MRVGSIGSILNKYYQTKQKETDVMKTLLTILSILSLALFASCGDKGGEAEGEGNKTEGNASS
jgi:hypothetical protein